MTGVLTVRGLGARTPGGAVLLDGVDLDLAPGQVLAVVGASGAGKSTLGLALLGEAAPGLHLTGSVQVQGPVQLQGPGRMDGTELLGRPLPALRRARAGRVGHLPQHPGVVLDPVRRTGPVLDELAATVHGRGRTHRQARAAAVAGALELAGLGGEPELARRFPHQLSGGQQQRMALAQTLVTGPDVVVLDEPTTGLDPDTTGAVVERLAAVARAGTALVLLTHDTGTAAALADEVVELHAGRVLRRGTAAELLAPAATGTGREHRPGGDVLLAVTGLSVSTPAGALLLSDVDLTVSRGGLLAVVGPSGAGKTTLGRAIAGLAPCTGEVRVGGSPVTGRRAVQYVHQDCRSAFLDHRPVLDQVARPAELLRRLPRADARAAARTVLARLGLDSGTAARRPGELSGGQLQRASVARALLARPAVLVADEATSALDGEHRRLLLGELDRARREDGLAVVLISHDPAVVATANWVLALAGGRVAPDPGGTVVLIT
ncbi:peptide/nickel transport system ATP-binding protein [Pseudonocardia ammonioxydans]|uniref:Peptide/nickel transport system ATP-binding protein n=1 Tax=Pseudonocardia ammonioxydans TaxID=260086 RepID=A0A1I4S6L3_PSUAM|nr:ATP-binding cassette domain-containing protein [Pseudonocardia ammonioxydans]SFM59910.1 peptide/nickel transport system ATP-binding protein [Pseudonocardia ammonioxydans]